MFKDKRFTSTFEGPPLARDTRHKLVQVAKEIAGLLLHLEAPAMWVFARDRLRGLGFLGDGLALPGHVSDVLLTLKELKSLQLDVNV